MENDKDIKKMQKNSAEKTEEKMTIQELENTYIEDLNMLGDWILQYEYLLRLSSGLTRMEESKKTEENKVKGCQSGVWLELSCADGKVRVQADSDAMIIRGIVSIIVSLLDSRTPAEVAEYRPEFIGKTNIGRQISTDRFRGIHSIICAIQEFAVKYN